MNWPERSVADRDQIYDEVQCAASWAITALQATESTNTANSSTSPKYPSERCKRDA